MSSTTPEKANGTFFRGMIQRFGVLSSTQLVGSAISFLTVLLITRSGGAEVFGQIALAISVLNYALVVTMFGTNISGVGETAARPRDIGILLPAILLIRLFFATISFAVILVLGPFIAPEPQARLALYIIGAGVFAGVFSPTWLPQGLENLRVTAATIVGPFVLTLLFSAIAAFMFPQAWGFGLARLIGDVLIAAFLMVWARKYFTSVEFAAVLEKAKWLARKSAAITASQLVRGLAFLADVLIVAWFSTDSTLGHFSAAQRIYLLLTTISASYFIILYPRLARASADNIGALRDEMIVSLKPGIPGAIAVAVIVAISSPLAIPLVFGADFAESVVPMQFLGAAAAIGFIHRTFGQVLLAIDKAYLFLWATAISTVVGTLVKIVATQHFGINGTSAAVVTSELMMLGLTWQFVRHSLAKGQDGQFKTK